MFKIATTPTYTTPVTVQLPGSKTKQVFDAEFKRLSQPDLAELTERVNRKELDDVQFCREVMVGWKGVSDENGELEFSPGELDKLLAIYPVAAAIVHAFYDSIAGAKAKN